MIAPSFFDRIAGVIAKADGGNVTVSIGDTRPDGTADIEVAINGEVLDVFVGSQAEMKVFALEVGGYAVPHDMRRAANEARARREAGMQRGEAQS